MSARVNWLSLGIGVLLALAAAVLLVLTLFADEVFPEYSPAHRGRQVAVAAGCFSCHGGLGTVPSLNPGRGPEATVPDMVHERMDLDELRQWIRDGISEERRQSQAFQAARQNRVIHMPAFGSRLASSEIEDLVAYLALQQYAHSARFRPAPSAGETLARRYACFTCHGELGQGGVENPGSLKGYIPGFFGNDFRALTRNGERQDLREWILDGHSQSFWQQGFAGFYPGQYFTHRQSIKMPAYRGFISDEEVETLVDYLLELMELGPLSGEALLAYRPMGDSEGHGPPAGTADLEASRATDPLPDGANRSGGGSGASRAGETGDGRQAPAATEPAPATAGPAAAALAILREHCLRCHGPEKQRSSYRMDRHEALLKGGEIAEFKGTAAVIPGDPDGSLMIRFVEAEAEDPLEEIYPMPPPDDNPRLTREQIETLRTWIRLGARWEDR
ncbi:MAG: hypothetical protein Kow001_08170 [Acidobacteriota bacterium]